MNDISRRQLVIGSATMGATIAIGDSLVSSASAQKGFDFSKPLDGWETVAGRWATEEVTGAAHGGRALVQRATDNEYNVVVAPGGPYDDVIVTVRFKPISGREDASGGIVFRFADGRYYVVRANAIEDNFRLYYYDRGRHMLATAAVKPPALGQWITLQISAKRDRLQAWLNDRQLIDHRDARFTVGRIGLWTKADSVTAFDSLNLLPIERR
jgi:Domain of Unknown Function (DUF1080)